MTETIPRGVIVPNTVTKTLRTDKVYEPDLSSYSIEAYPDYSPLEDQVRTIRAFDRPIILVDDILHDGKRLFGLIVSSYSGGDLLARQLISALNMNKSFFLPPHFCLLETANERGSLIRLPGIARRAHEFAAQLSRS